MWVRNSVFVSGWADVGVGESVNGQTDVCVCVCVCVCECC